MPLRFVLDDIAESECDAVIYAATPEALDAGAAPAPGTEPEEEREIFANLGEDEARITEAEYRRLLLDRDPGRMTVSKTRYRIPWGGHVLEFDLYPFWSDRAILEIELESEEDAAEIPAWVQIVRDVTGEGRYKNSQIARTVPMEEL